MRSASVIALTFGLPDFTASTAFAAAFDAIIQDPDIVRRIFSFFRSARRASDRRNTWSGLEYPIFALNGGISPAKKIFPFSARAPNKKKIPGHHVSSRYSLALSRPTRIPPPHSFTRCCFPSYERGHCIICRCWNYSPRR